MKFFLKHWPLLCGPFLFSGCATLVPEHTLFLGEVAHIATADDVEQGLQLGPVKVLPATPYVKNCKSQSSEHEGFAIVRFSYFWSRAGGPIYSDLSWAIVPGGVELSKGNLVELEIARSKQNPDFQCPIVKAIRFQDLKVGMCEYQLNSRGVMGTVVDVSQLTVGLGGRGSSSIYCPDLEKEGWEFVRQGPEKAMAWKKSVQ